MQCTFQSTSHIAFSHHNHLPHEAGSIMNTAVLQMEKLRHNDLSHWVSKWEEKFDSRLSKMFEGGRAHVEVRENFQVWVLASPPLRQGLSSSLVLFTAVLIRIAGPQVLGFWEVLQSASHLTSLCWDYRSFNVGCGSPNLGTRAWAASSLSAEPFPQTNQQAGFYFLFLLTGNNCTL